MRSLFYVNWHSMWNYLTEQNTPVKEKKKYLCDTMGDKACKTALEFCATFLISIRITFFILLISTLLIGGTTVNDGFVASLAVLGSLGMIALDICMMHGILNTKSGLFLICLAFNHLINLMNYFAGPQNLGLTFSSSWATMIFGTESFQTGQELLGFVTILEFWRLNLLTLVHLEWTLWILQTNQTCHFGQSENCRENCPHQKWEERKERR